MCQARSSGKWQKCASCFDSGKGRTDSIFTALYTYCALLCARSPEHRLCRFIRAHLYQSPRAHTTAHQPHPQNRTTYKIVVKPEPHQFAFFAEDRVVRPKNEGDVQPFFFLALSAVDGVVGAVRTGEATEGEEALRAGDRDATAAAAVSAAAAAAALVLRVTVLVVSLAGTAAAELLPLLERLRAATAGRGRLMTKSGAPEASVSSR